MWLVKKNSMDGSKIEDELSTPTPVYLENLSVQLEQYCVEILAFHHYFQQMTLKFP